MVDRLSANTSASMKGLFFAESDASDNTNWVANNSPTNMDMDTYTIDLEYIKLTNWKRLKDDEVYKWWIEDYTDGEALTATFGEEKNDYVVQGDINNQQRMEGIKDFCKRHNRDDAHTIYMFNRYGNTSCEMFYGADFSEYKYLPGKIIRRSIVQSEDASKNWQVTIHFRGALE